MPELPQRLFLEITTECNFKCKLCKLWQRKDPAYKLSLADKVQFLNDFIIWLENNSKKYHNSRSIILTGGEPFLYPNQIFEIASICKNNGIKCYVNTNGSLIDSKINEILNSGLTALTISIDSHLGKIHDDLRGFSGLFNKLIKILKMIISKKDENGYSIKLCVQSILGGWNINTLPAHINFFKELGIDGLMFQPIQYPFGLQIPKNWYKKFDKFPHSEEEVRNAINYLFSLKQNNGFIMNSKEEIELWRDYFQNPEYLPSQNNPCRSYEQNLIVDVSGNVKFCFNKELEPKNKIGNILNTSIDDLWNGKMALQVKESMRSCNRACGVMNCHIDKNLIKE